ncbi:ubiquinol-cytochrome C chaperone family protein [Stappia indica]|uniref:ubiquinol-cytochrome C chaperone family protein n=1 Tax=Stappia indica TaxID=538381 RepID=UPI001CD3782D|nr:ubiquinol-cytochrome C chaperone family protein [Stappia indica]MCA1297211.1 ubiquinol-cytochrome C chaperone [Stappia indica]
MVFGLFRRRKRPEVFTTYSAIVAQARQAHFYSDLRVPDTLDGRFELIMLHAILLFDRLRGEGDAASAFGQEVFDLFFQDMDHSLREMGVGDLTVPKKIKKMAEAFYGRAGVYSEALASESRHMLVEALDRNIFAEASDLPAAAALADYVRAACGTLGEQPLPEVMSGSLNWPEATGFIAKDT